MVPSSGFKYFISNTSYEAPLYSWLASSIFKTAELKELAYMTDVNPPANLLFATVTYLLEASPDDPFSGLVFRAASDREFDHDRCEAEFVAFCGRHWDIIKNYVNTRNFQLNEVRRAPWIYLAIRMAMEMLGEKAVVLLEFGASAGLNLLLDHYQYLETGCGERFGRRNGEVLIPTTISNVPAALMGPLHIRSRIGIDLHPLNVEKEEDLRWLRAAVWPEAIKRRALLDNAISYGK
jgi:hypothetical protein